MLFERAVPPGSAISPEQCYTAMALSDLAPGDRPYVVCNFVSSADGKATASGKTALLGGEGDRAVFHLLRTQVDAILAGTGTLRVERYGRLVRREGMPEIRAAEGRDPQPLAVVISRSGDVPFDIPLFSDDQTHVALYAPPGTAVPAVAARVTVHEFTGDGTLLAVMRSLREDHGVRTLLCEGGPVLFNALLIEDLVDELFLTLAPALVGGQELGITSGPDLGGLRTLRMVWTLEYEGHLFMRYALARSASENG